MTKVICLAHQKGGVGKSTLSLNLAYCFQNGLKVGLMDADLQGSLNSLKIMTDGIELLPFEKELSNIHENKMDIVIIDTPPYLSSSLPGLFLHSDLVLIPTKAGFFDMMAIKATIAMVKEAMLKKNKIKSGIVFNMVKPNSSISKELRGLIDGGPIPILNSIITERVSYTRSIINGGVFNTNDEKAKIEVIDLADELLRMLGL